jgi:hypothetical protein
MEMLPTIERDRVFDRAAVFQSMDGHRAPVAFVIRH